MRTVSRLLAVTLFFSAGAAAAQVKKGKTRPLETEHLMEGLVAPHNENLKKALGATALDDKAWHAAAVDAALLNEASYVLMDDGRSPDDVWADASVKLLRQGTADLLKAIAVKDLAAAKTAMAEAGKSCKSCHTVHKKKKK